MVTVNPEAEVVLPHTYTPRGASLLTAFSIFKEHFMDTVGMGDEKYFDGGACPS